MPSARELAGSLGLPVRDLELLAEALVHRSYTNERPAAPVASNDRLEFLGDSVIALIVSEALFTRHPDEDEGALTTRRATIISTAGLAALARRIGLGSYLLLGAGADRSGERERDSVLEGSFEAVAGAIFLDLGMEATREWLLALLAPELDAPRPAGSLKPAKSQLQEESYARTGSAPTYRVVSAEGPDHDKLYVVEVQVGPDVLATGQGRNRRDAETDAAGAALSRLPGRTTGTSPGVLEG